MRQSMKKVAITCLLLGAFVLAQPAVPLTGPPGLNKTGLNKISQGAMNMSVPIRSEPDFIRGMIPHHQEAVGSAAVVARNSERPELRAFAKEVVRMQQREINTLQGWLRAWYPDGLNAPSPYAPMMRTLPDATPDEADHAFIEDMIMHHEMAVAMAKRFLVGSFDKHPEVEALARDIIATQAAEVSTLRGWLHDWYGVKVDATRRTHS